MRQFFIKIEQIIDGWWMYITDNKDRRSMRDDRMKECKPCIHRRGIICGDCGCFLEAKTRVYEAECPVGNWDAKPIPEN